MPKKHINYEKLIDISMHNIVRESLKTITDSTTPGNHHFYLSFITTAPGVIIPEHLKAIYPKEMTIVLQYQFEDLEVRTHDFSVNLTFNGKKSHLTIPYKALTSFTDPSVNFGIKFQYFERTYKNKELKKETKEQYTSNIKYTSQKPITIQQKNQTSHNISTKQKNNVIQLKSFQKKPKTPKEKNSK